MDDADESKKKKKNIADELQPAAHYKVPLCYASLIRFALQL